MHRRRARQVGRVAGQRPRRRGGVRLQAAPRRRDHGDRRVGPGRRQARGDLRRHDPDRRLADRRGARLPRRRRGRDRRGRDPRPVPRRLAGPARGERPVRPDRRDRQSPPRGGATGGVPRGREHRKPPDGASDLQPLVGAVMRLVKVAVACVNQTPFAWDDNLAHLRTAIEQARAEGATLLCLPELAITGYGCDGTFFMSGLWDTAFAQLEALAALTTGMVVAVGLPVYHEKALYDAAALLSDGHIVGFVGKQFLAGDGIHYEPRWFKAWPAGEVDVLERPGHA